VHEVVFESLVGGDKFRAEPGETLIALETSDGQTFALLGQQWSDDPSLAVTDSIIENYRELAETQLVAIDDHTRRTAAMSQDAFWLRRHELAREVVGPEQLTPNPSLHPIDAFIAAKIEGAKARISTEDSAVAKQFHDKVLPILRGRCQRCHGDKETAGLS